MNKKQELILVKGDDTRALDKKLADGWSAISVSAAGITTLLKCTAYCYVLLEKEVNV